MNEPHCLNIDLKTLQFLKKAINGIVLITIACSEIPFSKNSSNKATMQLICNANKLTGFYMIQGISE